MNVIDIASKIQTEGDAWCYMESLRWPDGPICPHCECTDATFIQPTNGTSRKTRTGADTERRVWRCCHCRKQFTVLVGTVFGAVDGALELGREVLGQVGPGPVENVLTCGVVDPDMLGEVLPDAQVGVRHVGVERRAAGVDVGPDGSGESVAVTLGTTAERASPRSASMSVNTAVLGAK